MSDGAVRLLGRADATQALILYNELSVGPAANNPDTFVSVIEHPGTSVFGVFCDADLAAMVTLHLLPNVLWDTRPYGLIENVVTRGLYQREGYGRQVMEAAIDHAWQANAYKLMLMTGQRRGAKGFYEAVGFSSEDKFAMVLRCGGSAVAQSV